MSPSTSAPSRPEPQYYLTWVIGLLRIPREGNSNCREPFVRRDEAHDQAHNRSTTPSHPLWSVAEEIDSTQTSMRFDDITQTPGQRSTTDSTGGAADSTIEDSSTKSISLTRPTGPSQSPGKRSTTDSAVVEDSSSECTAPAQLITATTEWSALNTSPLAKDIVEIEKTENTYYSAHTTASTVNSERTTAPTTAEDAQTPTTPSTSTDPTMDLSGEIGTTDTTATAEDNQTTMTHSTTVDLSGDFDTTDATAMAENILTTTTLSTTTEPIMGLSGDIDTTDTAAMAKASQSTTTPTTATAPSGSATGTSTNAEDIQSAARPSTTTGYTADRGGGADLVSCGIRIRPTKPSGYFSKLLVRPKETL
ncbi:MAG: hypothetical protein KVP17_003551 [Porospora cf. gigantea B]|uniref:uncharacterized protein n=1 Tax=Porospora cf. gigantea B TaxID=2853592 RepID=UPI00357196BB|nr:MAG: hypothetical protein KVP17_003551 [Porospora cf. gigantea B]